MSPDEQSRVMCPASLICSNRRSPHPMAAGSPNSAHRMAICEFAPPNLVTSPAISCDRIQSNPGSAFSIAMIL